MFQSISSPPVASGGKEDNLLLHLNVYLNINDLTGRSSSPGGQGEEGYCIHLPSNHKCILLISKIVYNLDLPYLKEPSPVDKENPPTVEEKVDSPVREAVETFAYNF